MTSHPVPAWEERETARATGRWRTALLGVALPVFAPNQSPMSDATARLWWRVVCALSVLPIAGLLHWGLFHHPTCMLNNFGHEYTPAVIWAWLSRDPALPWAIVGMIGAYRLGLRSALLRALIAPGFITGILFTLWIWDIPFSGRAVCGHFHDAEFMLTATIALKTKHILGVSAAMYLVAMCWVLPRFVGAVARSDAAPRRRPEAAPAVAPVGIPVYATASYPRARLNPDMER